MQKPLHIRTKVQSGCKIGIVDQEVLVGEPVDVVVSRLLMSERRAAVDILAGAPVGLVFKTAARRHPLA